jgi:predicted Rossmann fold flavoprotein
MNKQVWDVVVVGAGPAGMMAALEAASRGAKVLILEKNHRPGEKLLITGGGRCNLTNAEPDLRKLLSKFKDADKFLFSPFSEFDNKKTLEFFEGRGMPTKVEAEQRVFPESNSAESVWNVLTENLREKATIKTDAEVKGFIKKGGIVEAVELKNKEIIYAHSFILAAGGKSRPETGSTGDGFVWLRELGHTVTEPTPSLVPVAIEDNWVRSIPGLSLPDAKLTIYQNNVKQETNKGKILFTHFGLSGPAVLNMSRSIDDLLKYGEVELSLDLLPQHDYGTLNTRLQELFKAKDKKKIKNALSELVPGALVEAVLQRSTILPETKSHSVSRESRLLLVQVLKDMRMKVKGLLGEHKAIITSGGVALTEVDFKTMRSRLFPNLYIVGDLLDIDRPSGGYSLQLCWTTGFVAGKNAANK